MYASSTRRQHSLPLRKHQAAAIEACPGDYKSRQQPREVGLRRLINLADAGRLRVTVGAVSNCRLACTRFYHRLETSMTTAPSNPYFAAVAEQWDEIRSDYFTEHMRDAAIDKAHLPASAVVADVGTGTGFVARRLVERAARVIGFDASPDMLAVARRNLAQFNNVEFREATGDQLPVPDETFDGVFANMYLHHAPDPLATIKEMARVLKNGGVLCITDLDTHDHEWQREQTRAPHATACGAVQVWRTCGWASSVMIFASGMQRRA
jgi:ubiquinone/menaquinone biosynthesis C-methylase UbiE